MDWREANLVIDYTGDRIDDIKEISSLLEIGYCAVQMKTSNSTYSNVVVLTDYYEAVSQGLLFEEAQNILRNWMREHGIFTPRMELVKIITKDDLTAEDVDEEKVRTNIDWDYVLKTLQQADIEINSEEQIGIKRVYVGSVMGLTPSGKYYTPFANSNVTDYEARLDEIWWEKIEKEAEEHGVFIEAGEGSPTDIFVGQVIHRVTEDLHYVGHIELPEDFNTLEPGITKVLTELVDKNKEEAHIYRVWIPEKSVIGLIVMSQPVDKEELKDMFKVELILSEEEKGESF